ncbi:MAG TPA: metallophosphatase family protein [Candidatus Eubacterium pullicola]|nr:metallophosphatase family protein [Candidatus Eubacterium pullicola]
MIYITGDCHADFTRFKTSIFPEQKEMTKEDYVIICGDFGGVWQQENGRYIKQENRALDVLNERSFTTLFVDGNHENFDRLDAFPVKEWHGGKVHEIRPSVLHLMRGEVFEIEGKSFFAFGGASSHDIKDGILERDDKGKWKKIARQWDLEGKMFRIDGISWWKRELPSEEEKANGLCNLQERDNKVDYILTHCAPASITAILGGGLYEQDYLTMYLEEIHQQVQFKKWFFGHYHVDKQVTAEDIALYEQIIKIL